MKINPKLARRLWKALIANATELIDDANVLFKRGSYGRARSLAVLAQEELGKALWIYKAFSFSWDLGTRQPKEIPKLTSDAENRTAMYLEAEIYGQGLASFWGDYSANKFSEEDTSMSTEEWLANWRSKAEAASKQAEAASKQAEKDKISGFYVEMDSVNRTIHTPSDISPGTIYRDIQTLAKVLEMLIIEDHTRMKEDALTPYDSVRDQQFRLLPLTHPEEWAIAIQEFEDGDSEGEPE